MKKLLMLLPLFVFASQNQDVKAQIEALKKEFNQKIQKLQKRVDENEFEASLNRIKWGGELEVNWGFYRGNVAGESFSNPNKWDMRLKLNMEARINERTKFTGRLMMSKAWGNSNGVKLSQLDALQGRADGSSSLYVERAYVDYYFNKRFAMTIGRQPSSDGPGMNLKYDTPRKATYPALLFNGAADGVVFTYKYPNKYIKKCKFRLAYGKGYEWIDSNSGWFAPNPGIEDTNVYGVFFEGALPYNIGKNLFILSGVKTTHLVTNPFDSDDAASNQDLGDYEHLGFYFENLKAFDTKFNYFISAAKSIPKSNGNKGLADLDGDGIPETEVELLKKSGFAYHIGMRYDFSKIKIGYEFNRGSKYWFSFSTNLYDVTNKLAMRGPVHDFYAIYKVDLFQYFRLGFTYMKQKYDYIGMYYAPNGEPPRVDNKYSLFYLTYDVRW